MKTKSIEYYLSLGSNLGDRAANLEKAFHFLRSQGEIVHSSCLYETTPVGMDSGAQEFYNLVLRLKTPVSISPLDLLREIKTFEKSMGRDSEQSHYLPRVIDIDILLAGDRVIDSPELAIPHKEMTRRAFVLVPLAEIAPDLVHPVLKKTVKELLEQLPAPDNGYKVTRLPDPKLLPWLTTYLLTILPL